MTDASVLAHEWVGMWETDAPLTHGQYLEDKVLLEATMVPLPTGVVLDCLEVWVNGRAYRWRNLDVTRVGYTP